MSLCACLLVGLVTCLCAELFVYVVEFVIWVLLGVCVWLFGVYLFVRLRACVCLCVHDCTCVRACLSV